MATAVDRRFELLQKRAEQQSASERETQQEQLKRSFARTGGLGSGAYVKTQAQAGEAAAKRLQTAREGIEMAKLGEQQRQEEMEQARQFQTAEREAAQAYGAEQATAQREFATSEAAKQREYATAERTAVQEYQKGLFDIEQAFKETMFTWQKSSEAKKYNLAMKQFGLEEEAQKFNQKLSNAMAASQGLPGFSVSLDLGRGWMTNVGGGMGPIDINWT